VVAGEYAAGRVGRKRSSVVRTSVCSGRSGAACSMEYQDKAGAKRRAGITAEGNPRTRVLNRKPASTPKCCRSDIGA
jgi:hypothetical protein